jgi:hypothetical protein
MICQYIRCGKDTGPSDGTRPRRFCNGKCSRSAWDLAHREANRLSAEASRVRRRERAQSWPTRRASIKADYGVPGMSTQGGRPVVRVKKAVKF